MHLVNFFFSDAIAFRLVEVLLDRHVYECARFVCLFYLQKLVFLNAQIEHLHICLE